MNSSRPVVLCFSGHDPSGGAGIQADIETLVSHQCHAASVITCLTEQDTSNVYQIWPQPASAIKAQAQRIMEDLSVKVIKIGLLGSAEIVLAIQELLLACPHIPVVFDPVLAAGGGAKLADAQLLQTITAHLLPLCKVLTPNFAEARQLTQLHDVNACGQALLDYGCQNVLLTGADEDTKVVQNFWFEANQPVESFTWERLPGSYHGSGCTLATATAALLAHGLEAFDAIVEAQEYTWNTLSAAYRPGKGQYNPNRFFWVERDA